MEVVIRPYHPADALAVVEVYRDAYDVLRQSRGGRHADHIVDRVQSMADEALLRRLLHGYHLVVAEDTVTSGRLLGIGAISDRPIDRLLGSARSKSHYVRLGLQRGQGGVGLGTLLRNATLARARELGRRKVWGYAQPESRGWHGKFGACFYPWHDTYNPEHSLMVSYYEIELRPSFWNRVRIEPCIFRLSKLIPTIRARIRDLKDGPSARV
jgi:hypothetical protein